MTNIEAALPNASVAIITRTKNRGRLLRRALHSVANQTRGDYVHIVVNDGGDRREVAEAVDVLPLESASRVHVLHNAECQGMEAAANAGIAACGSEFIVIHDDDDSWHPRFLEKTIGALTTTSRSGSCQGVVTHSYVIRETIRPAGVYALSRKLHSPRQITLFKMAMESFQFPNLSFLYRRAALETIGGYNETLPVMGDWDFNMRFLSRYDIELVAEPLANYHHRVGSHDSYSNSVNSAQTELWRIRSMLANRLLRTDLEQGRIGLGLLVNMGLEIKEIQDRLALMQFANPGLIAVLDFLRRLFRSAAERRALRDLNRQWQDYLIDKPSPPGSTSNSAIAAP